MRICIKCSGEKDEKEFSENSSWCKVCVREKSKNHYENNRDKILAKQHIKNKEKADFINSFKNGKSCEKCGYDKYVAALDFHHKDPSKKEFDISWFMQSRGRKSDHLLLEEIKKCVILCANCHREFHYLNKKEGITLEQYFAL